MSRRIRTGPEDWDHTGGRRGQRYDPPDQCDPPVRYDPPRRLSGVNLTEGLPLFVIIVLCIVFGYLAISTLVRNNPLDVFSGIDSESGTQLNLIEYCDKYQLGIESGSFSQTVLSEAVTTTGVNVRVNASAESRRLVTLEERTPVQLTGERRGDWFGVNVEGKLCWMNGKYLKPKN